MVHAGEKLYQERIKKGYTLEEVSKATKIRSSFLGYIEKGEYDEEKFIKVLPDGFARKGDFPLSKIKFAQSFKLYILIAVVLVVYIIFQYRAAIFNPSLNVSKPTEGEIVKTQKVDVV